MSYSVPCNTDAPLTVSENGQLKFAVNGSLNKVLLTHPYRTVSLLRTANSSYTGSFEREYGRCGDQINTPPGQPIKFETATSLFTTCNTEASSYSSNNGSVAFDPYVTEYDDISETGYVILRPCCEGDCVQKSSAAGGGGIQAFLPGNSNSGVSVVRTYESTFPYCTSCTGGGPSPCNEQSLVTEGGVCRVRSDEEIKTIYCGDDISGEQSEQNGTLLISFCGQADIDGGLPFYQGSFKGEPGKSYVQFSFNAGMEFDCIQYASSSLLSRIADNTQVILDAPGALHIETTGSGAIAIFDNFTKPTSFMFNVTISAEYEETYTAPWGSGPYIEAECIGMRTGYLKSVSESYSFSYTEIIDL